MGIPKGAGRPEIYFGQLGILRDGGRGGVWRKAYLLWNFYLFPRFGRQGGETCVVVQPMRPRTVREASKPKHPPSTNLS